MERRVGKLLKQASLSLESIENFPFWLVQIGRFVGELDVRSRRFHFVEDQSAPRRTGTHTSRVDELTKLASVPFDILVHDVHGTGEGVSSRGVKC